MIRLFFFIPLLVYTSLICADPMANETGPELDLSRLKPEDEVKKNDPALTQGPDLWGIALTFRTAEIPFAAEEDTVSDVVPLLFYEDGRFFWRGLEAGYNFAEYERWSMAVMGRYRYFDIPAEFQNEIRGNAYDLGFRYRYKASPELNADFELMNDTEGRIHANAKANFHWDSGDWDLMPYATLRWKSSEFNNHYYGLGIDQPGSEFDMTIGGTVRYHVYQNFYLLGRASLTMFGPDTYRTSVVDTPNQTELYLGIAFFDDKRETKPQFLKSKPYIRVAHGKATPSNLGTIIRGDKESDPYGNRLTSTFYGVPLSDTLFGINMPIYFTPGFVWHHSSEVQGSFPEYVVAIKAYYTIKWPTNWRVGVAEGLSYSTEITYIEQTEMDEKDYRASNLLNFLDFSIDIDLGDLFNSKAMEDLWLGYSIHHRSGIFETSSAFGRIKGGSNYTTFYLQYHW